MIQSQSEAHSVKEDVVLQVENLQTTFNTPRGRIKAVDGVSFSLRQGQRLGIVGESGSGKSVTSMSILRLIDPPGEVTGGQILFRGQDLRALDDKTFLSLRGKDLCLVFQDPMSALNPVYRVGKQVMEQILAHQSVSRKAAREKAIELFRMVGIPDPERRIDEYPHNLSGGMRQRVTIAMAMANAPDLLVLDEPTTALDVTIQAQVLDVIRSLENTTVMLITHDMDVVREVCDHVVVMYAGRVMERGSVEAVIENPRHPYTEALLASRPTAELKGKPLPASPGTVPSPLDMPPGCPFAPRCSKAFERCTTPPPTFEISPLQSSSCWLEEKRSVDESS